MKHLGVKVKESRGFENKAKFVNLLPKIKVKNPLTCVVPRANVSEIFYFYFTNIMTVFALSRRL